MQDLPTIEYDDLAIRIGADGRGGFEARVLRSPAGGVGKAAFEPPYDAAGLDAVLDGIVRAVRGGGRSARHLEAGQGTGAEPFDPKIAGMALFDALFRGDVRRCLDRTLSGGTGDEVRGIRLRLIIDPREPGCAAIAALPWELLYDPAGGGYLCIRKRTPVVRFLEVVASHRVQAVRGPLRVLVALASPAELPPLDLEAERRAAEEWGRARGVEVEFVEKATVDEVKKRLRRRRFHALHFTGHGDFPDARGRGVLYFEREGGGAEAIGGEHLAALLDDRPGVRLVVLNACFGGRIPRREGRDPFAGVASALVRSGVPAVVAMQAPISDGAAVRFCREFYRSLAEAEPVDAAVAEGRRGIYREAPGSLEWAAPVLHLRVTDGRLFERRPAGRRRLLAAAGALLLVVAGAVGGWLWFGRSRDVARDGPPPYQRPVVSSDPGCPPPSALPDVALVRIEPGRLELSSGRGKDEPPRILEVEKPYCLGVFEVTEEEWRTVMGIGEGDPAGPVEGDYPVGSVDWDDGQGFLTRINRSVSGSPFRLPTGAEWEWAARARTTTTFSFGDDPAELRLNGNCLSGRPDDDGFDKHRSPVGWFKPNPWGLYDMHGNVWEWVDQAPPPQIREEPEGESTNDAPPAKVRRVRRGGSYASRPELCAADAWRDVISDRELKVNGFRLARDVEPDE